MFYSWYRYRINLVQIIKLFKTKFVLCLNHKVLYDLFFVYLAERCDMDDCLPFLIRLKLQGLWNNLRSLLSRPAILLSLLRSLVSLLSCI
jgi:hypothetical protein